MKKPVNFLPANAHASSLIVIGQTLYATTIDNCGDVPNGVSSVDMANNNTVNSWKAGTASPVGDIAFSPAGTVYVAVPDGVVALDPMTLAEKNRFKVPKGQLATGTVVFTTDGRELVAAGAKDGNIYFLDAISLQQTGSGLTPGAPSALAASPGLLVTAARNRVYALKAAGEMGASGWVSSTAFAAPAPGRPDRRG